MRCNKCGWEGPYHGWVCPACGANKTWDKLIHLIACLVGLAAAGVTMFLLNPEHLLASWFPGFIAGLAAFGLTRAVLQKPWTTLILVGLVVAALFFILKNPELARGWYNRLTGTKAATSAPNAQPSDAPVPPAPKAQ
jgi:hypothetical protein